MILSFIPPQMANELAKLSTDAALQINANKTKVMINSAEIETNLSGEFLEYISEFT
jgi:hypothetical protein